MTHSYPIRDFVDILHLQGVTRRFASALGFPSRACSELAIVVSELSSNILKYGESGSVDLCPTEQEDAPGILLVAHDRGPPFKNLETALLDGYDDSGPIDPMRILARKGIGGGLGAIARLTHGMRVEPEEGGKRVLVVRYLNRK